MFTQDIILTLWLKHALHKELQVNYYQHVAVALRARGLGIRLDNRS